MEKKKTKKKVKTKTGVTLKMAKNSEARAIRAERSAPTDLLGVTVGKTPESKMDDATLIEREIRRYIRKEGGFRKGISEEDKKQALRLLKLADRADDLSWDTDIVVPGVDNPSVSGIVFRDKK